MMDEIESLGLNLSRDVAAAAEDVVALRRAIHRRPELSFKELATQKLVLDTLTKWGIEAKPMAGTGVVGLIRGEKPGPVLLLRADMDALPIDETCPVPWKSEVQGVMHACGHDAHTAIVLTAARIIAERGLASGAVKLMFQPAEEGEGGAISMVEAGVLKDPTVDAAIGFHVWTGYDIGEVVANPGPVAASVDGFKISVHGKGTHAATPEEGVDPMAIAAQIVTVAQSLITRRKSPRDPAVLSFTQINGGKAFNIIPDRAEILGTFRTYDNGVRNRLKADLENLARAMAEPFGASATYETFTENMPVVNDEETSALVREAACQVVGASRLITPPPLMVGEDFGEVIDRVPGTFAVLGCRSSDPNTHHPHHHPSFNIDERVLLIGVEIAARAAGDFCGLGTS
jgi:amidohydrolase